MAKLIKLDKFLLIRSLACLVVFFSHIPFSNLYNQNNQFAKILTFNGSAAVTIFFILSGYLITKQFLSEKYSLDSSGAKTFWLSRIHRIVPTTYLATIICVLLKIEILTTSEGRKKLIESFLFYFDVDSKPDFMRQLWSLSVEMQFYFLAPVLLFLLNKPLKKLKYIIFFIILTFVSSFVYRRFLISILEQSSILNQLRHFGLHFPFLFFGILTAYFESWYNKSNSQTIQLLKIKEHFKNNSSLYFWVLLALNFTSIWVIKILFGAKSFDNIWFTWFQMIIVSIMILFANIKNTQVKVFSFFINQKPNIKQRIVNFFNNLGILSFPFYLIHSEIIFLVTKTTNNLWLVITESFVISFAISIGIHFLVRFRTTKQKTSLI